MSNLIPPLLSSSPPPIVGPPDEDDDDEFGDFRAAANSYDCDDFSLPSSPQVSPEKELKTECFKVNLDINSNKSQKVTSTLEMPSQNLDGSFFMEEVDKDFQDRRKSEEVELKECETEVNCSHSQSNSFEIDQDDSARISPLDKQESHQQITDQNHIGNDSDENDPNHLGNDSDENDPNHLGNDSDENDPNHLGNDLDDEQKSDFDEGENTLNNEQSIHENADLEPDIKESLKNDCIEQLSDEITLPESSTNLNFPSNLTGDGSKSSEDDFGDFANFENKVEDLEDEFDEFVCPPDNDPQIDDDFGDFESSEFAGMSGQTETPTLLVIDEKSAADKSETILKDIFPPVDVKIDEFECGDETKENTVFQELKDVTETKALIYQWSKSNSQKLFFKALNIDTRNILYGPTWNSSTPRFAANLGLTPLEPIRTEILTPTLVQNASSPSNSSQKNSDIPTAQFDWSDSGLINPLDSMSSEAPGSVPDDSPQEPVLPDKKSPSLFDKETHSRPEVPEIPEFPKPTQYEDFSSFQSPKLFPLRETHISTEPESNNKPGWLQPTILTPDLPRKETVVDPLDDDEFDDFQMVLPEEKNAKESELQTLTLSDLNELNMTKVPSNQTHEHILSGPAVQTNDDEFTDFHSSLPQILTPQPVAFEPLKPLKPLKPIVQYTKPMTQINWPDPGVTDEDIQNIELSYSRKSEKPEKPETKELDKGNPDDDEWTDFVSVTNPVKSVLPERTATPDLPLSVLNLGHVQAPKQPIPVITPSGLVQTKLSSNITLQPKSIVQTTVQNNTFKPSTQFQPSLISTQYAANFPGTQDDDDDWSDFVSGQPPAQNGYQQKPQKTPQIWTNATTNIIMNPTFQSYGNQSKPRHIPSISAIPDLDFIAPKNRTSKK